MDKKQRIVGNLFAELDVQAMNFYTPTSTVVKHDDARRSNGLADQIAVADFNAKPLKKGGRHV